MDAYDFYSKVQSLYDAAQELKATFDENGEAAKFVDEVVAGAFSETKSGRLEYIDGELKVVLYGPDKWCAGDIHYIEVGLGCIVKDAGFELASNDGLNPVRAESLREAARYLLAEAERLEEKPSRNQEIIALSRQGKTYKEISRLVGLSKDRVGEIVRHSKADADKMQRDADLFGVPLEDNLKNLRLSIRTENGLRSHQIHSISSLSNVGQEIESFENIGNVGLREIYAALIAAGYSPKFSVGGRRDAATRKRLR